MERLGVSSEESSMHLKLGAHFGVRALFQDIQIESGHSLSAVLPYRNLLHPGVIATNGPFLA